MNIKLFCGLSLLSLNTYAISPSQPNIIVLIADDISLSDFGCYGHPVIKTPHIDALASDGIRFTNLFLTTSSSSPSRASIITGRYPHNTGACELHAPIGEEQVSLAKVLKERGYYTAQAGKWHFGSSSALPSGPLVKDFDRTGGSVKDGGGYSGAQKWVSYLKERPKDRPFFMWFAAHDAHREWDDDQSLPRYQAANVVLSPFFRDDVATRSDFASYYYEVSRFDHFVGAVVQELKAQHVYEQTFIVVMADNGRPFPHAKTRLIPEGIKSPFIIHYPKEVAHPGSICESLVSSIDLAPTLAEIAQVKSPATFQGQSFLPLLSHPERPFRNYVFAEHNWHDYEAYERMVCDGNYLLIENKRTALTAEGSKDSMGGGAGKSLKKGFQAGVLTPLQADLFHTPRPSYELYECQTDTWQLHNLAAEQPQLLRKLLKVLHRWQTQTHDTCPLEITHDWYSRETLKKLPDFGVRKEMPGVAAEANRTKHKGPF